MGVRLRVPGRWVRRRRGTWVRWRWSPAWAYQRLAWAWERRRARRRVGPEVASSLPVLGRASLGRVDELRAADVGDALGRVLAQVRGDQAAKTSCSNASQLEGDESGDHW